MRSSRLTLPLLLAALLVALPCRAKSSETHTLRLANGSVVEGRIVSQTDAETIVQTAYGPLRIPASELRWIDDDEAPALRDAPAPDAAQLRRLHTQGSQLHSQKQYRRAIATYKRLLELSPDDSIALYNTSCGYALLGEHEQALDYLELSVLAGFVDFDHIRVDTDLDSLRKEPRYLALLSQEQEWVSKATARKTDRLLRDLRRKGCKGHYKVFVDHEHNFIWLHDKSPERFAAIREQLDRYAEIQWRDLFRNRPQRPLHIVLLTREDGPAMLDPNVGGYFNPANNQLICGDIPSFAITKTSVTIHEFTHALHFADQEARKQPHPIWLVEGLGALFESSKVVDGHVVPLDSARLATVQRALRRGGTIPWRTMMQMSQPSFMANAGLAYAQARYMLLYMARNGWLKRFYDEYTKGENFQGDRTALEAFEVVFGKPIDEVERDWKAWVMKQKVPPIPFIGIRTQPVRGGSKIMILVPGSGAAKAGLKVGDVLTKADGSPLNSPEDILEVLSTRDVSDVVTFEVTRDGKTLEIAVTLGERR
jgi:hypothetical protein